LIFRIFGRVRPFAHKISIAEISLLYCDDPSFIEVNFRIVGDVFLKAAGFLLLLAGWGLVLATLVLLGSAPARTAFVLAGIGVEIVGMVLVARAHLPVQEDRG
jgi:hypothetical protein